MFPQLLLLCLVLYYFGEGENNTVSFMVPNLQFCPQSCQLVKVITAFYSFLFMQKESMAPRDRFKVIT